MFSKNIKNIFIFSLITLSVQTYSFLGEDVSDTTEKYVESIKDKLDPNLKIDSIVNMNKFMRYLFGQQNAMAIPYLNYIFINEDWFKKLPEESQRFLIGYCIMQLINKEHFHKAYATCYALMALLYAGGQNPLAAHMLTELIMFYPSRQALYRLDKETAKKLNCAKGAINLFKDIDKFKSDGTFLCNICSTVNIMHLIPGATIADAFTPGRLTNRSCSVGNFFANFPLLHYLGMYPRHYDRMTALKALAKKQSKK